MQCQLGAAYPDAVQCFVAKAYPHCSSKLLGPQVHTCMHAMTGLSQMQVSKQSQKHAAQLEAFQYAVGSRRPAKPHCSKELLNQRRVIDLLARQGCYSKAAAVQQATNGMEAAEMKATLATFEAEVCLHYHQCACHHHACNQFQSARRA